MWYRQAQGFGGGVLSPVEVAIQRALSPNSASSVTPDASIIPAQDGQVESTDNQEQSPMNENPDAYEQRIWDTLVNRTDGAQADGVSVDGGKISGDGGAVEAGDARRLSPFHQNPEETTMEEQLESVRQQNVNTDPTQSMSSTENSRGNELVRGEFPHASGKGWNGYEDLPSDKSWA
jgi:hypothetical protein